jgi:hypothetical protein
LQQGHPALFDAHPVGRAQAVTHHEYGGNVGAGDVSEQDQAQEGEANEG